MGNGSVAIAGGAGFLGAHCLRGFEARGARVLPLVRVLEDRSPAGALPLDDAIVHPRALAGVDVMVYVAASRFRHGMEAATYRDANVERLLRAMRACAEAGVGRFVLVSSVGVYGFPTRLPVSEEYPYAPRTLASATKVEAEVRARRAARELGLALVIARPTMVYGPGDRRGMIAKMAAMIRAGTYRVVGSGDNVLHHVHVDDVVEGLWLATTRVEALDEDFILGGPETIELAQLSDLVARAIVRPLPKRHVPSVLARAVATVVDVAAHRGIAFGAWEAPVNHEKLDGLTLSLRFDIAKARARLGFSPRVGYGEGIMRTLRGEWPALARAGAET